MKTIGAAAILISALGTAISLADQPHSGMDGVSVAQNSEQVLPDKSAQTNDGPYLNFARGGGGGGGAGGGAPQSLINANQASLQPPGWHDYHAGPFEMLLNWMNGTGSGRDHVPEHRGAVQPNAERKN